MIKTTRAQVIAYRVAAQGFDRATKRADRLAVLSIGVQDASPELARLAMDARLSSAPAPDVFGPDQPLALVWSLRGAPYVHRRRELNALAGALFPLSEADATAKINETGPSVARAGIAALEQYALATEAMQAVVRRPTGKGAVSTAATKRLPDVMGRACRACKATHISDSVMRPTSLTAGLELQPGTSPPVLQPRPDARVPVRTDRAALTRLVLDYLRLLGPATPGDVADYLAARRPDLLDVWPDGLVEVSVDGRSAWLPADCVDDLTSAPAPDLVRLLGGFDPYLQARDRDLIVPEKTVQKALWPVLGRPGALFVDGEIAGTWRPKASGKKLTLAVEAFAPLPPAVRESIEAEARRVGIVRGFDPDLVQVSVS